jgi:hypothetical protein
LAGNITGLVQVPSAELAGKRIQLLKVGVILMQYLPFADDKALATYDAFERGAYQLVSAER